MLWGVGSDRFLSSTCQVPLLNHGGRDDSFHFTTCCRRAACQQHIRAAIGPQPYLQNFDCVDEPTLDLDFNGVRAQSDPAEMQTPICQPITEPTQDPTGGDIKHTAHLYVVLPMFSVDNDQNPNDAMPCPNGGRPGDLCGPLLGAALISAFGFVPEAWKTHPLVATQCPDPNHPVPGTCTMHPSSVDLSVTLAALG